MREIKFRGWYENQMLSAEDLVDMDQNTHAMYTILTESHLTKDGVFMQYTGLKDKNGREIYEGDIVKFCDFDSLRTGGNTSDKIQIATVMESECSWIVNNDRYSDFLYHAWANDSELEVIGNIYENPELVA